MRTTATGSLPGQDFRGAVAAVTELMDPAFMPELPARGIEAETVGRALGLLPDLPVDLEPSGWRLAASAGAEQRRAAAWWRRDLDDLEEKLQDFDGTLKVAVAGPWTLAASVGLPRGERVLSDTGAVRDVSQALEAGIASLLAELSRRLPSVTVQLQVDEPLLSQVSGGRIRTASGFSRYEPVGRHDLASTLQPFGPGAVLHCCDGSGWLTTAREAGFAGVAVDARHARSPAAAEELAAWVDAGRDVHAGVVDTREPTLQGPDLLVGRALEVVRAWEMEPDRLQAQLVLSTACGLTGWDAALANSQLQALREAAPLLAEQIAR